MEWWIWMLVGLGLLILEMIVPGGLFFLFFGLGALIVGLLVGIGAGGPTWLQWVLFGCASILMLLFVRKKALLMWQRNSQSLRKEEMLGEIATADEGLAPGGIGKVELRGTTWKAKNISDRQIHQGQRCRVQGVEGLTLHIESI